MSRKRWQIKLGTSRTLIVTVPGKWKEFGQYSTWTVQNCLGHTYRLGFAEAWLYISGAGAAYRLKQKEKEALRQAQQPFILLRPAFAPMVSAKE